MSNLLLALPGGKYSFYHAGQPGFKLQTSYPKPYTNFSPSARRPHREGGDVDFINQRNAFFNKQVERALGPYSKEIKANLERGTALPD